MRRVIFFVGNLIVVSALARAEIVYLANGDVIHGTLVAANNTEVTLKTPYGELVIPKEVIERIDYEAATSPSDPGEGSTPVVDVDRPPPEGGRAEIVLRITGRSFWYAFESPSDRPADTRLRLRVYAGNARACTFVDEKADTFDGNTLYNSFTFAPEDAVLEETLDGFACRVEKSAEDTITLTLMVPPDNAASGRQLVRMVYEFNSGDRGAPLWTDLVSRSFSVEVVPSRQTLVFLEQNADALEYSGLFKKRMKNVELFQLNVVSTELKD
ncbi:MAG TPA: hypothetical protein VLK65_17145 [Vicinamibacteria bacterium]|nr:hypothetical protein [Vicinamibacteria bacterium]